MFFIRFVFAFRVTDLSLQVIMVGRFKFTQEMIEDTTKEIAFLRLNKTTRDVSVSDMKEVYPDIAEEVEKEIEDREWFTDVAGK